MQFASANTGTSKNACQVTIEKFLEFLVPML